jgi:large subunit ribosomal protein L21
MYAVIRAGGKQYRVAPGDVIKVEKLPSEDGKIEFTDVLAVSGEQGAISRPESGARVVGTVVEEGRGDKILVFHFKRKKQYKKLQGHRQPFTAVRISEIAFDGQTFKAPDLEKKQARVKEKPEAAAGQAPKTGPRAQKAKGAETRAAAPARKAAAKGGKKTAAKKSGKKSTGKKK